MRRLHATRDMGLTPEGERGLVNESHCGEGFLLGLTFLLLLSAPYNFAPWHRHFSVHLHWVSVFPSPRVSMSLNQGLFWRSHPSQFLPPVPLPHGCLSSLPCISPFLRLSVSSSGLGAHSNYSGTQQLLNSGGVSELLIERMMSTD